MRKKLLSDLFKYNMLLLLRICKTPFVLCKTISAVSFAMISDQTGIKMKTTIGGDKRWKIGNRKMTITTMRAATNVPVFDLQVQKTWPSFRAARGAGRPRFHPPFSLSRLFHPPVIRIPSVKALCMYVCVLPLSFSFSHNPPITYKPPCRLRERWTASGDISDHAKIPLRFVDPVGVG